MFNINEMDNLAEEVENIFINDLQILPWKLKKRHGVKVGSKLVTIYDI